MPVPKTVGELIEQTWPKAEDIHDVEIYLDTVFAERGDDWLEAPSQQHWIGAESDIKRLTKKKAAARRPRSRGRKSAASSRVQLELQIA